MDTRDIPIETVSEHANGGGEKPYIEFHNVFKAFGERKILEDVSFDVLPGEKEIVQVVDGLLEMVGVKPMRDLLPSDLSTGMKRSVAIARALAAQPDAILYDEPTTMVDPLMANLLGDLIAKLKEQLKLTSVVVTHDMRLAKKLADRVVFLHEAKVAFFGTVDEMVRSESEIVRDFLRLDDVSLLDLRLPPPQENPDQPRT
jgi:phospholipid/cholesterol/gamma-HCH transport system ATP-binding protein